uniref:cell division protein ZipA-like n=1 Tax=Epinephelus lanceolatus TaxID=310571 RepID=UPI0014485D5B|nr:cell division protein ZipA-like [Epinephelus lanceolatus]
MIILILLSCFTIMVSAVPVCPYAHATPLPQGGTAEAQGLAEATSQLPDAQTPAPLSPNVGQLQPWVPPQPGPQVGPQFMLPAQHYIWSALGGSPVIIPLQPGVYGAQPANQPALPQQPLVYPSYRYFPHFSSPYSNQLYSPYGFPVIPQPPLPQTPATQPQNYDVLPVQTPGAGPGEAPQPVQQQQTPQIVYLLQQAKGSALGSLSSEELQMAAKMGQLGVYLTNVLTNSPAGGILPVNQAAGLVNSEQQGIGPTAGTPAGIQQTPGPASSGPQANTNSGPVGLEKATQGAVTAQTPVQAKLQPTVGNHI